LHKFTNLSNPVDFAGRLVYDADGDPVINFGKHKGKKVISIFETEPSYYSWMQNGDFPLYTKRVLEKLWESFRESKKAQRVEQKGESRPQPARPQSGPRANTTEKSRPVTDDMLKQLQGKFGK